MKYDLLARLVVAWDSIAVTQHRPQLRVPRHHRPLHLRSPRVLRYLLLRWKTCDFTTNSF